MAVWAYVLETASQAENRGDFGAIDAEALDCLFGFPDTETRTANILEAMEGRGLTIGNRIAAWEKRQPKREREDNASAERQAASRASKNHVTPCHTKQNQVTPDSASDDQKKPRVEESRVEENTSPSLRSGEGGADKPRTSRKKREETTLTTYLANCKQDGIKPIPADHSIRDYCRDAGISDEMLQVAWCVFRDDYQAGTNKSKRYKDWPGHFANAVRGCWAKLWYTDAAAGCVVWTSRGLQEKAVLDARARAKETEAA